MSEKLDNKIVLVTGAARRIGAVIARRFHECGARVAVHYRGSADDAEALVRQMNKQRPKSAAAFHQDLQYTDELPGLIADVLDWGGRLDVLVNNASSFYPTPPGEIDTDDWTDLMGSNLKAPLFLSQAAIPALRRSHGTIINIVDIHAKRPLRDHTVYGSAKAGLAMLTRSLAKDLAPDIRVNGVAPGAILWPEEGMTESIQENILGQVPLGRAGQPEDIANCAIYLASEADYITGQVIAVDGGRSIGW